MGVGGYSHALLGGSDRGEARLAVDEGQLPEGAPRAILKHLLFHPCRHRRAQRSLIMEGSLSIDSVDHY